MARERKYRLASSLAQNIEGVRVALAAQAAFPVKFELRPQDVPALERFMKDNDIAYVGDAFRAALITVTGVESKQTVVNRVKGRAISLELRRWVLGKIIGALRDMVIELEGTLLTNVDDEMARLQAEHPEVFEDTPDENQG